MMLFQRRYRSVIWFINLKLCDQSNFPPPPSAFYFLILCHQLFFSFSQESSTNSSCIVELSPSVASCTNWLPVSSLLLPVCSDEWMVSFKLPLVTQVVVYAIRPTSWKQLVPFRFAFLLFWTVSHKSYENNSTAQSCTMLFFTNAQMCESSSYLLTPHLWAIMVGWQNATCL